MYSTTPERGASMEKTDLPAACPCKRRKCPRHGDCAACRAHHAGRRCPPACENQPVSSPPKTDAAVPLAPRRSSPRHNAASAPETAADRREK